jgi:hypothetical protein
MVETKKIPKALLVAVNWRRTDNTMVKRKKIKERTMIYKTQNLSLKLDQVHISIDGKYV